MKVHLIRSEEISTRRFRTIVGIAEKVKGPIEFIVRTEDIVRDPTDDNEENVDQDRPEQKINPTLEITECSRLFGFCEEFRSQNKNINDEELVVYFTDHPNEINWFSSWDPTGKLNFFIQTSGWENFVESEFCYPVVYELITIPLYLSVCSNLEEVEAMAHYDWPRGCPFDFCGDKIQVLLRLRTGDVCPDCREKMIEKKIDPAIARQVFAVLEEIRSQMLFRKRFGITGTLSRMDIDTLNSKLVFKDIGDISVELEARQMVFYLFFLIHPEGINFRKMEKYFEEIRILYRNFTSDAILPRFTNALKSMTKTDLPNSKSWLVTHINNAIEGTIGEEIAPQYIIDRRRHAKKHGVKSVEHEHFISLDRKLITINGIPFREGVKRYLFHY